jgi:hypothetical protein
MDFHFLKLLNETNNKIFGIIYEKCYFELCIRICRILFKQFLAVNFREFAKTEITEGNIVTNQLTRHVLFFDLSQSGPVRY